MGVDDSSPFKLRRENKTGGDIIEGKLNDVQSQKFEIDSKVK